MEQILAQQLVFLQEPEIDVVNCNIHTNTVFVQKNHGVGRQLQQSLSVFSLFQNVFILTVLVSCPSGLLPCAACIACALVQVVESSYDVDVHEEEIVGDEKYLVFICFIER